MTPHITFPRFFTFALFLSLLGLSLSAQTPKAVDLGLSVKWADCNLGATSPEQIGDPYAFGETTTKDNGKFNSANYIFAKNGTLTAWGAKDQYTGVKNKKSFFEKICQEREFWCNNEENSLWHPVAKYKSRIKPEYDPARVNLPKGWRLPTIEEWIEVTKNCKQESIKYHGKTCKKYTAPNGNYIIVPSTGYLSDNISFLDSNEKSKRREKDAQFYLTSDLIIQTYHNPKIEDYSIGSYPIYKSWLTGTLMPWDGLYVRAVYDPSLLDDNNNNNDKRVDPSPNPGPGPKPEPKPEPVVDKNKPSLTFIGWSESTHSPKVTLKVGVKSASAITGTAVYVNGQQTRGIKAVNNDGYDMMINQEITLAEGNNTVRVDVTNATGTTSQTAKVFYMPVVEDEKEVVPELRKVAFVVGNSAYPGNELSNPKNDAADISAKLRSLGFDVITLVDGTRRQIEEGISTFSRKAADADVAMFFYAGHGIQYNGANYLIPVDAELRSAKDIGYECTDVNRLLENMEESGCKMNIIALDACRNNPFERGWYRGSSSKGLSAINAPIGTFISYATSPGSVAADGTTRNSPYTSALLTVLNEKGLPIETVFKKVAEQVYESTDHRQTPWYSSSLFKGEFIFNPGKF